MVGGKRWISKLAKIKRKTFLVKLIVTTAFIAVVPNLISDFFAYVKVSKTFEQETGNAKLQYLHQTINAVEIILGRIQENSRQLALSRALQDFESFPNGNYYEALQGELPHEDLLALYSYLQAKQDAYLTLNAFKLSNAFVDSVYFYDNKKQLILTSESDGSNRQFSKETFYDKAWFDALDARASSLIVLNPRIAARFHAGDVGVLSIIHKSGDGRNAVVVNLNASKLYAGIVNRLNEEEDDDELYVVSSEARILFHADPTKLQRPLTGVLPDGERTIGGTGSFVVDAGKERRLVSYATSSLLGWTFVNDADLHALAQGTISIKRTIQLSAAALILLSIALAYVSSKRMYKPISRLSDLVHGRLETKAGPVDEISRIGMFMESTLHERDLYKERLEESLPFHREQFKASLLHRHSSTLEELEEKKTYLSLDIDCYGLSLLLLAWDPSNAGRNLIASELFKWEVTDAILQDGAFSGNYFVVEAGKDEVAIVLNCSSSDRQRLFQAGQTLLDRLKGRFGTTFTIGLGHYCETILELPRAYEEAAEALKYRILFGKGDVISIEEIRNESESEYVYPKHKEEKLLSHIKTARAEEARQVLDEIVEGIVTSKNSLHYKQIQPIFMRLLTEIMTSFARLGADLRTAGGAEADPYRELLEQDSLDRIHSWFGDLIRRAAAQIERELNSKSNQHISKVVDIVERDFGRDLSLLSVAEQLHLNPAYISRLFKQITGQSFVEYLKRVRIERSKELLASSDLKVNEIGKRVGYENSYYFIKVFKDMIGLTPGEYKKLYGS